MYLYVNIDACSVSYLIPIRVQEALGHETNPFYKLDQDEKVQWYSFIVDLNAPTTGFGLMRWAFPARI
jgi:hypothetical protein